LKQIAEHLNAETGKMTAALADVMHGEKVTFSVPKEIACHVEF
jgi:hypothetical protein